MAPAPRFAYPVVLLLAGRKALVVGGGRVARRKARALADAGAEVHVVALEIAPEIAADPRFTCHAEPYAAPHLDGARVAVAATGDASVNARVATDARAAGVWVNVVDVPDLSDFIVPAVVRRGDLVVAVTTGGAAPSLSRRIRERLEQEFGPEYEPYLAAAREVRERVKASGLSPERRRRLFERLTEDDVVAAAREGSEALASKIEMIVSEPGDEA